MRLKIIQASLAALLAALLVASGGFARLRYTQAPQQELTVSAAISLKEVLDKVAQLYRVERPGTVIHFNLGASGTLQRQIEQGAPVDIFISASEDQMDSLASKGLLLAGTRRDLVKNAVVLIVPKGKTGISSVQDLTRPEVKVIAIGEPQTVPAGKYAQEVLTHFEAQICAREGRAPGINVRHHRQRGCWHRLCHRCDDHTGSHCRRNCARGFAFAGDLSCRYFERLERSRPGEAFPEFSWGNEGTGGIREIRIRASGKIEESV